MLDKLKEIKSIIEVVPNIMTKMRGRLLVDKLIAIHTPTKENTLYYDGTYIHLYRCTNCDSQITVESDDSSSKPPKHCHECGCFLR